ncbi:MAG: hypothetical protein [Caudoviricetes sp.]|nr:MAG: hypothetical protein [Caudoviricetes sp.]
MNDLTEGIIAAAILLVVATMGFVTGVHHNQFKELKIQQKLVADRDKLQVSLTQKDQQIQQLQTVQNEKQDKVIIQKEVVYRDKIKEADVRKCIADSGLLGLYDATVSGTGK